MYFLFLVKAFSALPASGSVLPSFLLSMYPGWVDSAGAEEQEMDQPQTSPSHPFPAFVCRYGRFCVTSAGLHFLPSSISTLHVVSNKYTPFQSCHSAFVWFYLLLRLGIFSPLTVATSLSPIPSPRACRKLQTLRGEKFSLGYTLRFLKS